MMALERDGDGEAIGTSKDPPHDELAERVRRLSNASQPRSGSELGFGEGTGMGAGSSGR